MARHRGINHNIVYRWIRDRAPGVMVVTADAAAVPAYIPVHLSVNAVCLVIGIPMSGNGGGPVTSADRRGQDLGAAELGYRQMSAPFTQNSGQTCYCLFDCSFNAFSIAL